MRKIESYGHVKAGVLKISYRDKFIAALKQFEDCRVRIVVEKAYKKRSTSKIQDNGTVTRGENGYYWGVIVSEYVRGVWEVQQRIITSRQAHDELKANCNCVEHYNERTGEIMREIQSTAEHTTMEAEEYYSKCRAFILDWFGVDVPLPGEQGELEFGLG